MRLPKRQLGKDYVITDPGGNGDGPHDIYDVIAPGVWRLITIQHGISPKRLLDWQYDLAPADGPHVDPMATPPPPRDRKGAEFKGRNSFAIK